MGGGYPWYGSPREASSPELPCLDSQLRQINSACLLLAITLTKLTHWGLPLLRVDSSARHGGGECLMRLMGSHTICHTLD